MSKIIQIAVAPGGEDCRIFALRDDGVAFELIQEGDYDELLNKYVLQDPFWKALPDIPQIPNPQEERKKERLAQLIDESTPLLKAQNYALWCANQREIAALETQLGLR